MLNAETAAQMSQMIPMYVYNKSMLPSFTWLEKGDNFVLSNFRLKVEYHCQVFCECVFDINIVQSGLLHLPNWLCLMLKHRHRCHNDIHAHDKSTSFTGFC